MKRTFEKISFDNFKETVSDDINLYNKFNIPVRKTKNSAGYDFESLTNIVLSPGDKVVLPTGVKVKMAEDEMLMIVVRSSSGFKYNIRLCNQVGIVESDYYNNPDNEGHIFIALQNEGDRDFEIKIGDRIAQGIFTKFLTVTDEDEITDIRTSGIGSTGRRKDDKNDKYKRR